MSDNSDEFHQLVLDGWVELHFKDSFQHSKRYYFKDIRHHKNHNGFYFIHYEDYHLQFPIENLMLVEVHYNSPPVRAQEIARMKLEREFLDGH